MTDKSDSVVLENNFMLFIDVETTGADVLKHDMLCFAAVIIDIKTGKFIDEFKVYLEPRNGAINWERRCKEEFWYRPDNTENTKQTLYDLERYKVPIKLGMQQFYDWVNKKQSKDVLDNLTIYTDTSGFDICWINVYLSLAGLFRFTLRSRGLCHVSPML